MLLASQGWPQGPISLWIIACMIFARTAAMAFNRWTDWHLDQLNPRTTYRSKLATRNQTLALFIISLALFLLSTSQTNLLCLILSPIAIILFCGYSLMKRFSPLSHFVLGLALAAAPIGAWIAITGNASHPLPWTLATAVTLWVAGLDIIYATQDIESDRQLHLHSIPALLGFTTSLKIAAAAHTLATIAFITLGLLGAFHPPYYAICLLIALLLITQHRLAAHKTPHSIQHAFFTTNVSISLLFLAAIIIELWIRSLPDTTSKT
jgi:4-hydroxybenzoate polyprenyltransferase